MIRILGKLCVRMNPVERGRVCGVLALILFFFMSGTAVATRPFLIVGSEWPPYDMSVDGQPAGLGIEISLHVLDSMGVAYEVVHLPWKRAIDYVRKGKADAIAEVSIKREREQFLLYPETPVHRSEYVFFVNRENETKISVTSYADLKKYRMGVTNGYAYTRGLWAALHEGKKYIANTEDQQSLKMLAVSRIDLFPCDRANGIFLAKHLEILDKVTCLPWVFSEKNYYMAFSRASDYPNIERLAQEYDEKLKRFKTTEDYRKIVARYLH